MIMLVSFFMVIAVCFFVFFKCIADTNLSDDQTVQLENVLSKLNFFFFKCSLFWALPRRGTEPEETLGTMYH